MPRLDGNMESHTTGRGGYAFTGARIERLQTTNITLATIIVDVTGSVNRFAAELDQMIRNAIEGCKKAPQSDSIMIRLVFFSDRFQDNVEEVFGFTPVADIDLNAIPKVVAGGNTPLFDATFEAIAATNAYGQTLRDNDFGVNGIGIYLTDGSDNASVLGPADVKREHDLAVSTEQLESFVSVLVGINAQVYRHELERFQRDASLTQYTDAGEATAGRLGKLAGFISRSVSSQSQALGTGGPSQQIAATI